MRTKLLVYFLLFFVLGIFLSGKELKFIEKWKHDKLIYGHHFASVTDNTGNLISMFFRNGILISNKKNISYFTTYGKGPGEILSWSYLCKFNDDIAVFENNPSRIKIYKRDNNKYKWDHDVYLNNEGCSQIISSAIYFKEKWFVSGEIFDYKYLKKRRRFAYFLKVYNEKGKFQKNLIKLNIEREMRFNLMNYYLLKLKDSIIFIFENKLSLYLISGKELKLKRIINLDIPSFYKTIPKDYYVFRKVPIKNLKENFEKWKTNYSRITNVIKYKNYFVIQIRTANKNMKNFALLIYNIEDYNLENIIFTDDLLLTINNDNFYFFENGNPTFDELSGDFSINIFKLRENK